MADMTASFEMTPDAERFLRAPGGEAEYVVFGPVNIEIELKSGEVVRPQEIRERVTRCRDCAISEPCSSPGYLTCYRMGALVKSDGFCAWGEPREVSE